MPIATRYRVHDGAVIWPEHKPLPVVLKLKNETPYDVWETTYQSNPVAAGGAIFKREYFDNSRYDAGDRSLVNLCVARWHSWDTALKDDTDNAYTALTVGELTRDYRLITREVWRGRVPFAGLINEVTRFAERDYRDRKLNGIIIEDKASGISAIQTLQSSAAGWLRELIIPFNPRGDKEQRGNQASVWCKNGSVLLPHPSEHAPWLLDFENELFSFPGSAFKDQVDSFSQLVIYTENLLAEGLRARSETQ